VISKFHTSEICEGVMVKDDFSNYGTKTMYLDNSGNWRHTNYTLLLSKNDKKKIHFVKYI